MGAITVEELKSMIDQNKVELPSLVDKQVSEILAKKETEEKKEEKSEVEQKQLAGVMRTEIMGIPIGQALVGGGVALAVAELVDGLIGATVREKVGGRWAEALLKGGTAWAVKSWGPGIIGAGAADTAALFLAWEAIRSIIPIDEWISGVFKRGGSSSSSSSSTSDSIEEFLRG